MPCGEWAVGRKVAALNCGGASPSGLSVNRRGRTSINTDNDSVPYLSSQVLYSKRQELGVERLLGRVERFRWMRGEPEESKVKGPALQNRGLIG